jgi:fermentation-respiration switch protein FrsA (DUF1100 family)
LNSCIRKSARSDFGFVFDVAFPIRDVPKARTPVLLGHGARDNFVPLAHSRRIFSAYGLADKQLYVFDAEHFKSRPYHWYGVAGRFVYKKLGRAAGGPRF